MGQSILLSKCESSNEAISNIIEVVQVPEPARTFRGGLHNPVQVIGWEPFSKTQQSFWVVEPSKIIFFSQNAVSEKEDAVLPNPIFETTDLFQFFT